MDHRWTQEEIRLTRFAWGLYDLERASRRDMVVGAVAAVAMGVALLVLVTL